MLACRRRGRARRCCRSKAYESRYGENKVIARCQSMNLVLSAWLVGCLYNNSLFCVYHGSWPQAELGTAQLSMVHHGTACHGIAQHDIAWHSVAQRGTAWHSMIQHGIAWHSVAQHGIAWPNMAHEGTVLHIMARWNYGATQATISMKHHHFFCCAVSLLCCQLAVLSACCAVSLLCC